MYCNSLVFGSEYIVALGLGWTEGSGELAPKFLATGREDVTVKRRTSRWKLLPGKQEAAPGRFWEWESRP